MEEDPFYREGALTLMRARGYRAARRTKGGTPWGNSRLTADGETLGDLPVLRDRARELHRDDPIASGLILSFINNTIGTGMRPQAQTGDTAVNARLEAVWRERAPMLALADDLSHGEAQRMYMAKCLEDGGILLRRVKRRPSEPVWFEAFEADRLDTPLDAEIPKGWSIRRGVEKDDAGVPVAYWVRKLPEYSRLTAIRGVPLPSLSFSAQDFHRLDRDECVYARVNVLRPGQSHGVTSLHAVMQDIRDLDLLMLAALKRTQIAACLAVFVTSEASVEDLFDETAERYGYRLDQDIEPGMIFKLFPGEKVDTLTPNFPMPELEPFVVMLARRIGAALGVSWQIVLKDFSQSNYSSARTDLLEARQVYTQLQRCFADRVLQWQWRVVMEDARLMGDRRLAGVGDEMLSQVSWIANGWQWVDPLKEAQATAVKLEAGLTTLRDECAAQGKDWEDLLDQRALELDRMRELGIVMEVQEGEDEPESDDEPAAEDRVREEVSERLRAVDSRLQAVDERWQTQREHLLQLVSSNGRKSGDVHFHPPEIKLELPEQPIPHVDVRAEAPTTIVNVPPAPPPDVHVHVPQQDPPPVHVDVTVEAPEVTVTPTIELEMPRLGDRKVTFERDRDGHIIEAEITEDE